MATLKQKKAIKNIVENHGNISRGMLEAGYDPTTAKNPKNLTTSKAWIQLMEDYISDDKLLKKHNEALEATKPIGAQILIDKNGQVISKENEGMIEVPDQVTRLKAVELGYRVKGKLRPEEGASTDIKILVMPSELAGKYDLEAVDSVTPK